MMKKTNNTSTSLINDLIELQRMASIRGLEIAVVIDHRKKPIESPITIDIPTKVIGIECLPARAFLKSNLL